MCRPSSQYALYKGEEYLGQGDIDYFVKKLHLKRKTIRFMTTPTAHKRNKGNARVLYRLDPDDE